MPKRSYSSAAGYRYGFNGKENDNDVKGLGNEVNFGARIYDSRIGRWLSLDPLQKKYPTESHYAFVSNNPILYADIDGRDKITSISIINKDGTVTQLTKTDKSDFKYSMDKTIIGVYQVYKQDIHQHIIYDLRKTDIVYDINKTDPSVLNESLIASFTISYGDRQQSSTSEFLGSIFTRDNSDNVKYGLIILGNGIEPHYYNGLPSAGEGSEIIDLKGWLNMVSDLRSGETLLDAWQKTLSFLKSKGIKFTSDQKALTEASEIIANTSSNLIDGMNKATDAVIDIKNKKNRSNFGSSLPDSGTCLTCEAKQDSSHIDEINGRGTFERLKKSGKTENTRKTKD